MGKKRSFNHLLGVDNADEMDIDLLREKLQKQKKSKPIQYTYFEKGSIQQHYAVIHGQGLPPDERVYQTPEYTEELRQRLL